MNPALLALLLTCTIIYIGVEFGVPCFPVFPIPHQPQGQLQLPQPVQENSPCPVPVYLQRHFCPGPKTEQNALNCAQARLARWTQMVQNGHAATAGPRPTVVTVMTGQTGYHTYTDPTTQINFCETNQRQTVFQCTTETNSAGARPRCRKLPQTCYVRHILPGGHFQFDADLNCHGGTRT